MLLSTFEDARLAIPDPELGCGGDQSLWNAAVLPQPG